MSYRGATAELFEVPRARPAARRGLRIAEPRPDGAPGVARAVSDAPRPTPQGIDRPAGAPRGVPDAEPRGAATGPSGLGPPPSRAVVTLLEAAREELRAAQDARQPAERFRAAHLGALRAAAAVLALRARARRASRPTDAWTLLATVAPEYAEWAAFFAAHSATRSAVDAGVRGRVSQRDADDMVRQADLFLALVTRTVAGRARA